MSAIEQYVKAMLDFARDAREETGDSDGLPLADIFEVETFFFGQPLD